MRPRSAEIFFRPFAYVHLTGRYPLVSLIVLGVLTALFCFFDLGSVITAAVCVRVMVQFIGQVVALHLVHTYHPEIKLPFRMWFYPVPSLIALAGWLFVLGTADWKILLLSLVVMASGMIVFVAGYSRSAT